MQKIILYMLLLTASSSFAQQITSTSLEKLDTAWTINTKTKIGANTRILATSQDPFPFCFSTAAAMLYDQTICTLNNKDCTQQPPTSFLAITSAGQGLNVKERINPLVGGSPIRSLEYLLAMGPVSTAQCNYTWLTTSKNTSSSNYSVYRLNNDLKPAQDNWKKYKTTAPYLSRFHKFQYKQILSDINPNITQQEIDQLIEEPFNLEKITAQLLLPSSCWQTTEKSSTQFELKFTKIDPKNLKQSFAIIEKLLKQKKPIIVNFCTTRPINGVCESYNNQNLHSFIIIAQATAVHKITEDKRTVYWVVNSWGETWQQQNSDGWVYADKLLEAVTGEIAWLEKSTKKQ